jgi:TM2 domain-containing membrane protein YozV
MTAVNTATGQKSWIVALLLCFFLGVLGVHRFYVGKVGTGILQIVTLGGFFGIWVLVDFIMIAIGKFSDKQGQPLAR